MSGFVWSPAPGARARHRVGRLLDRFGVDDIEALVERAAAEPDRFWPEVVEDLDVPFATPFTRVRDISRGPEWTDWFVGGTTNLAAACVHRHAGAAESRRTALVAYAAPTPRDGFVMEFYREEVIDVIGGRLYRDHRFDPRFAVFVQR